MTKNFVFDTNVVISAFLYQNSKPFEAFKIAKEKGQIFISRDVFEEYRQVINRSKFEKYLSNFRKEQILFILKNELQFITPTQIITTCRDPKDNKFLELAIAANASCIITGDDDLLVLNPFRNIPIMNPAEFLIGF